MDGQGEQFRSRKLAGRTVPPDEAITHFGEVSLGYDRGSAVAEARRGSGLSFERASRGCPFGVDVDGLVQAVAADDFDHALNIVREAHPWGGVLGRHCGAFCERAMAGAYPEGIEPLGLRELERAAADFGRPEPTVIESPPSGKHVAVVGAGPGGLAAALKLLQAGHQVTLFDRLPDVGGMFIAGYPAFRMSRAVLKRELPIQSPLLHLALGQRVGRADVDRMLAEYDATCLAVGHVEPADITVPGDELEGVYEAMDFLSSVSLGTAPDVGDRVAVLGAGQTAQDVARTARRLGAEVHVLYHSGVEQMKPGPRRRRSEMEAEGVQQHFFVKAVRMLGSDGHVAAVECQRMRLGEPDDLGRHPLNPADEPPFEFPATTVVKAMGQRPDFSILPEGVRVDGHNVANLRYHSSHRGLFVVGEISGVGKSDAAFLSGMEAAAQINRFLSDPQYEWPQV